MYGVSSNGSAPYGSKSSRGRAPRFFTYVSNLYLAATITGFLRDLLKSFAVTVTLAGAFVRSLPRALSASLLFITSQYHTVTRALSATLHLSVSFIKARAFVYAALITIGETFYQTKTIAYDVILTLSANVRREVHKYFAATLTLMGTLFRSYQRAITAALTLTTARIARSRAMTVTFTVVATMAKNVFRPFTASVFAVFSTLKRAPNKALSGALALTGGTIGRGRQQIASITMAVTSVKKTVSRSIVAVLHMSGTTAKNATRTLTMALYLSGSLLRVSVTKFFTGTLSIASTVSRAIAKKITATISLTASATKNVQRKAIGLLTLFGSQALIKTKTFDAALSLSVSYFRSITKTLAGWMSLNSAFTRYPKRTLLTLEWYSTYRAQSFNVYYSSDPHAKGALVKNDTNNYTTLRINAVDFDINTKTETFAYDSPFTAGTGWFAVYPVVDNVERECLIRKAAKI